MFTNNQSIGGINELYDDEVIPGPAWKDTCEHPNACYIGTVIDYLCSGDKKETPFDVYLYTGLRNRQEVCIRFSDEIGDYYSAGTVIDLIIHCYTCQPSPIPFYLKVARLILDKMSCKWTLDKT
jgi:hypothetical protein